ncbi:MAG: glutaredoxin family protein [Gammaproteobacteria bacterium]|jgi:thiol-disulfide isomerase/thioredoxin|nr:glutaredoxin family protein [Gammaproteobacteria bacterium]
MTDLIFFTTSACHLCEEAEQLLIAVAGGLAFELEVEAIDIAEATELVERYGVRIPVLRRNVDNAELDWPFDADALAPFLRVAHAECK